MPRERTYIMIKPDGVQRGLIGNIIERFEDKGFKLVAMKLATPTKEHLETHYADLKAKKFFPGLIEYMMMGPVCCMVWEGDNAVKTGRVMLGATNPKDSAPGTIRGDLCIDVGRNICHGSDAVESANAEIALWFPEGLNQYQHCSDGWVYEKADESVEESKAGDASGDLLTAGKDYNMYITYSDDKAVGQPAPSLEGLEVCQPGTLNAIPTYQKGKTTVVYFWARFIKDNAYGPLCGLDELDKKYANLQVVGIGIDPNKADVLKHIKKATKYGTIAGNKEWTGGKTDLTLAWEDSAPANGGPKVKKAFHKLTGMDSFMCPQAFIIDENGVIAWRQAFSRNTTPWATSRFTQQLSAVMGGKSLYSFGPNPTPQDDDSELEGYGSDDEAEDVFANAEPAADGAW